MPSADGPAGLSQLEAQGAEGGLSPREWAGGTLRGSGLLSRSKLGT